MDFAELKRLYDQPLFDLISQSRGDPSPALARRARCSFAPCSRSRPAAAREDCGYCAQSARYYTGVERGAADADR